MKPVIEIQSDGNNWVARVIDGSYETDRWGAPERALDALLDAISKDAIKKIVFGAEADRIVNSGACSGCYTDHWEDWDTGVVELAEAAAAHPAAAGIPDDDLWDDDWDWTGKVRG